MRAEGEDQEMEVTEEEEESCVTPRHGIPEKLQCPPPPKKKKPCAAKRDPPKNGYFKPDDLDALFSVDRRTESFV